MAFFSGVLLEDVPEPFEPPESSSPPHPTATTPNTSTKAASKMAARLRFGTACPPRIGFALRSPETPPVDLQATLREAAAA